MLNFFFKKKFLFGKAQSGFYIDFITKKLVEIFIINIYVFTSLFLLEKFLIEFLTKIVIIQFIFNFNKIIGFSNLNMGYFFYFVITTLVYLLIFINIVFC